MIRVLGWILVAAPLAAGTIAGTTESAAVRHFARHQELLARGRAADARQELIMAARLEPGNTGYAQALGLGVPLDASNPQVERLLARADAAYRDSRLEDAKRTWQEAVIADPSNSTAARGLRLLGEEAYRKDANQPYDETVDGLYQAAMRAVRRGETAPAISKLEDALRLNAVQPQVRQLYDQLQAASPAGGAGSGAEALAREARLARARRLRERQDYGAALERGREALSAGAWGAARRDFQEALDLQPGSGQAKAGLDKAAAALALQRGEAASKAAAAVREGKDWEQKGALEQALAAYNKALFLEPASPEALEGIRRVQNQRNTK